MPHTAKTDKVLNLFGNSEAAEAPVNPAIRLPEREVIPNVFVKSENGLQIVNVPFLLINEQLGGIMERFRCCSCEKCVTAATQRALKELPPVFVRVKRKSDAKAVDKAAAQMRGDAIRVITKAVMAVKTNPVH